MYLLFSGICYYPSGGSDDYVAHFDDIDSAIDAYNALPRTHYEWADVFCIETKKQVAYTNYYGDKWVFITDPDF